MYTYKFLVFLLFLAGFVIIDGEECATRQGNVFFCPLPENPIDFTNCCFEQNQTTTCCPPADNISDSLVMIISIFVILLCLTLSICFIICCFWSPCPLYSVCRINYTYGDIVAYTKEEEEALDLPPDNCKKNNYTPLHVKMKTFEED